MSQIFKSGVRAVFAAVLLAACTMPAFAQGTIGTIYDPKILSRMKFAGPQKKQVQAILDKSEVMMVKVFRKYRINPKAKPKFEELRKASSDFQAVEAWEKKQMKKVLSKAQYADYLEILQATAAIVIKATRDDN